MHQVEEIIYSRANGRVISQASLLSEPLNLDKFVALDRAELLNILKQDIEDDIHFNVTITDIKQSDVGVDILFSNPALNGHYQAVIGADGIYSTVRDLGFMQSDLVDLGVTNWRWVCEYPTEHVQPTYMFGMKNMFLAYPVGSNRIYCYAHQSDAATQYHNADEAHANLCQLFANYKGIAEPLLKLLPENHSIYTGRLRSVPAAVFSRGDVALIGDAGNACSPMLQQGAACAFEDAIVLSELLANFSVRDALEYYKDQRQQRVNWIVKTSDESITSFIKMNSRLSVTLRNLFIKHKGPLNVLGWKHLMASCPLDNLSNFIHSRTTKNRSTSLNKD